MNEMKGRNNFPIMYIFFVFVSEPHTVVFEDHPGSVLRNVWYWVSNPEFPQAKHAF